MKAITLTNPAGQTKEFTNVEFFEYKHQVVKSNVFKSWANENNVCGKYNHNGEERLNTSVVEKFLELKGYKWVENNKHKNRG